MKYTILALDNLPFDYKHGSKAFAQHLKVEAITALEPSYLEYLNQTLAQLSDSMLPLSRPQVVKVDGQWITLFKDNLDRYKHHEMIQMLCQEAWEASNHCIHIVSIFSEVLILNKNQQVPLFKANKLGLPFLSDPKIQEAQTVFVATDAYESKYLIATYKEFSQEGEIKRDV